MPGSQEDFVFAELILQRGYATEEQVQECLPFLERLRAEMKLEESLPDLMVRKGYLAPAQASVLKAEVHPDRSDRPKNAIEGYRLLARIGSGAMGSVYRAHHVKLDLPVALKVLRPSLASSRTQIERLRREAQLAARLNHPNVVRGLDVGESNGFHYLAMEFVEGKTVRDLIAKGPVGEKEALGIVRQVAAGLAHAHANGVVHRDVKPGNIMLTPEGVAKLADFGLARGQAPSDLTLEHASIGTPQYVAPEQMRRGSDATTRSDLFSLGATLYHMVTGRPPFDGANLGEIVQNVLSCRYAPPETVVPGLSRDACFVIGRLMRPNPRDRYASAAELVADLERIGRGEPIAPQDFVGDYQAFLRRRRARRNGIIAACVAVLLCAGAFLYQRQASRRERTELEARCSVVAATGADVATVDTKDGLEAAITAMTEAAAGSAGCAPSVIDPLRLRLRTAGEALLFLAAAERTLDRAKAPDANYSVLDAELKPAGLAGANRRIGAIRGEIRKLSDASARARYDRVVFDSWDEVKSETRALAADLRTRYLRIEERWVAEVAHARELLDAFDAPSPRIGTCRRDFDTALRDRDFASAAESLKQLRDEEKLRRDALFASPYLQRFQQLFALPDDMLADDLRSAEAEEWDKISSAAKSLIVGPPPRPDKAEKQLGDFLALASGTRKQVRDLHDLAKARREELVRSQLAEFDADDAVFKNSLKARAYAKAHREAAAVASSERWLPEPADRYLLLGERAAAVAELPARFLDGAKKQKKVSLGKLGEVLGKDIEGAPGDDEDLFVARRGRERIEFRLSDLERKELERIFAFEDLSAVGGWFKAAEAFREERSNPYTAKDLRVKARDALPKDDPWVADIEAALAETEKAIRLGEERAERAAADLKVAKDAGENLRALSLLLELDELKWTNFCKDKPEYPKLLDQFRSIASQQLLWRQLGLPESQIAYVTAETTTITFTGVKWCPFKVAPEAPPEEIDKVNRDFWEKWFRELKTDEKEIPDLVARATTQRLAWRGDVEVGPKGGYLPGPSARIEDVAQWQGDARRDLQPGSRPQPIRLDFPFVATRDWSIELEVRFPTAQPGYFAISCGQIQAVLGYFEGRSMGGGMKGACLVEADGMDPNGFAKQILDLQWHVVEDKENRPRLKAKEKGYLDRFAEGAPYRMRLAREKDMIVFEMCPLGVPEEKKADWTVRLEKKLDARKLDKLVTLDDGRTVFRFYGVLPAKGLAYELHDVRITGTLSEKKPDVE